MSTEILGICPDCGAAYRDPNDVLPPPSPLDVAEVRTMSWGEYAAQTHQDYECPIAKERELLAELEAVLRYFGIGDTLAALGELMRRHESDPEVIWGDSGRWFKKEQDDTLVARPLNCPACGLELGVVRRGRFMFGAALVVVTELEGDEEIGCNGCNTSVNLKAALSSGAEAPKTEPHGLRLVEPIEDGEHEN